MSTSYPGRAIRKGDWRDKLVKQVQRRLNDVGCGPLEPDGIFGAATESSVKLFQTRRGLVPDGALGPISWDELFGETPVAREDAPTPLLNMVLEIARSQIGVRESPSSPNRGPEVDQYVRSVGLEPAGDYPWCQAFMYWCFERAARVVKVANPCVKTAGVLDHWAKSPTTARIYAEAASDDPLRVRPGAIFIIDHGAGRGHAGLVTRVVGGEIDTVEGNTNERGGREGDGVYARSRTIAAIDVGFIDYGSAAAAGRRSATGSFRRPTGSFRRPPSSGS